MLNQHKILRVFQLISLLRAQPAKSIRYLSGVLSSTERTVYRYIDLLTELGFHIERDDQHRAFIASAEDDNKQVFSAEEVELLKRLLSTVSKGNLLQDSILQKLYINSEMQLQSGLLMRAHLGKMVEEINGAIQSRHQVILKKYHSANSNNISDRLVEPVKFSDNFQRLMAYEVSTKKNKYFNIERIHSVTITKTLFRHEDRHEFSQPDMFGFSCNGAKHKVDLLLNLRAYVILKEEYPTAVPYLRYDSATEKYRFRTTVNDYKPVTRFVLGLLEDIEVHGPKEFKEHLREHVKRVTG